MKRDWRRFEDRGFCFPDTLFAWFMIALAVLSLIGAILNCFGIFG